MANALKIGINRGMDNEKKSTTIQKMLIKNSLSLHLSQKMGYNQAPEDDAEDLQEVLLPESKLHNSEVTIFGQSKSNMIKIKDKSFRAFDTS